MFDSHLTFSDQISSLAKCYYYYHIRELRCIRPYLNFKTASTIATSIVHSKHDYCNSLYYSLPKSQINCLQVIQNFLARAVVKAAKFYHVTPILKSLHWLKINERIEYKLLSLTYKTLTTGTVYRLLFFRPWHHKILSKNISNHSCLDNLFVCCNVHTDYVSTLAAVCTT